MATPIVVPGSMPTMMYLRNFADEYAIINIYFILSLSYVNNHSLTYRRFCSTPQTDRKYLIVKAHVFFTNLVDGLCYMSMDVTPTLIQGHPLDTH